MVVTSHRLLSSAQQHSNGGVVMWIQAHDWKLIKLSHTGVSWLPDTYVPVRASMHVQASGLTVGSQRMVPEEIPGQQPEAADHT